MNDLISRSALIETLVNTESEVAKNAPFDAEWFTRMQDRQNEVIELIKLAPAVDAAQVKRGRWIFDECIEDSFAYQCSECRGYGHASNFCPHCGADMRREKGDEHV